MLNENLTTIFINVGLSINEKLKIIQKLNAKQRTAVDVLSRANPLKCIPLQMNSLGQLHQ